MIRINAGDKKKQTVITLHPGRVSYCDLTSPTKFTVARAPFPCENQCPVLHRAFRTLPVFVLPSPGCPKNHGKPRFSRVFQTSTDIESNILPLSSCNRKSSAADLLWTSHPQKHKACLCNQNKNYLTHTIGQFFHLFAGE